MQRNAHEFKELRLLANGPSLPSEEPANYSYCRKYERFPIGLQKVLRFVVVMRLERVAAEYRRSQEQKSWIRWPRKMFSKIVGTPTPSVFGLHKWSMLHDTIT